MTVEEARDLFKAVPSIREKMETLARVGLDYIHVGQQATTLSGGEAQRVKLSKELSQARHRPHALHPRRADHRPALPRRREAARGAARARRAGQHGGGDRAQPRGHQDRRLDHRHGPRGRRRRRRDRGARDARGRREGQGEPHRPLPQGGAGAAAAEEGDPEGAGQEDEREEDHPRAAEHRPTLLAGGTATKWVESAFGFARMAL